MSGPNCPLACSRCGALNTLDFDACIRCGESLRGTTPVTVDRRVAHGRRRAISRPPPLPIRQGGLQGTGSELLLGRFSATRLPVARALLAVNLVVYALHLMFAWQRAPSLGTLLLGGPQQEAIRFGALHAGSLEVLTTQPWRLLTACFVHFGALHVGMNMLGLLVLARTCEPMLGSVRMFLSYVFSGVVSFMVSAAWHLSWGTTTLTAGASGALFGMLGMVLGVLLRQRDPRYKNWLLQGVLYSLAFTLLMPSINHAAHFGGLVAGTLCGYLFGWGAPKPSLHWQRAGALALALVCVVALAITPFLPPRTFITIH